MPSLSSEYLSRCVMSHTFSIRRLGECRDHDGSIVPEMARISGLCNAQQRALIAAVMHRLLAECADSPPPAVPLLLAISIRLSHSPVTTQ